MRRVLGAGLLAGAVVLAGGARAAEHVVEQVDKTFSPGVLAIQAGDTVTFTNGDPFVHNMYSATPGFEFNLGAQNPGERKAVALKRPGTVTVECQIHPKMRLTVQVK